MTGTLKAAAAAAIVFGGSLTATSTADAGVGYYYEAPSYYVAPPVYSYGFGGYPAYGYGGYGYSGYGYGYQGYGYGSPGYGYGYPAYGGYGYGYPGYGFSGVYRSSGFRPSKFSGGFGLSTFR